MAYQCRGERYEYQMAEPFPFDCDKRYMGA